RDGLPGASGSRAGALSLKRTAPAPEPGGGDLVRTYLRDLGAVPLLDRAAEVAIARRMERWELEVYRALAEHPRFLEKHLELSKTDVLESFRKISALGDRIDRPPLRAGAGRGPTRGLRHPPRSPHEFASRLRRSTGSSVSCRVRNGNGPLRRRRCEGFRRQCGRSSGLGRS